MPDRLLNDWQQGRLPGWYTSICFDESILNAIKALAAVIVNNMIPSTKSIKL